MYYKRAYEYKDGLNAIIINILIYLYIIIKIAHFY